MNTFGPVLVISPLVSGIVSMSLSDLLDRVAFKRTFDGSIPYERDEKNIIKS